MSRVLTINAREYTPAGEVAKHFGYTRDYILMLSREGKIDAQKIGHRWYVNFDSAKSFFARAKVERDERRREMSEIRKIELQNAVTHAPREKHSRAKKSSRGVEVMAAVIVAFVVLGASYAGMYAPSVNQHASVSDESSFLSGLATRFYEWLTPDWKREEQHSNVVVPASTTSVNSANKSTTRSHAENETSGVSATRTVHTSLVVGPDEVMTTTKVEEIKDAFSDEVSVSLDPHDPNTGVIVPHFKNGDGEAYRFVLVPLDTGSNYRSEVSNGNVPVDESEPTE